QTCALPILESAPDDAVAVVFEDDDRCCRVSCSLCFFEDFGVLVEGLLDVGAVVLVEPPLGCVALDAVRAAVYGNHHGLSVSPLPVWRSEERRVGTRCSTS